MSVDIEACRFCLSTDLQNSYYPLLDQEDLDNLKASLALQTDLSDISLHPSSICDECSDVTKRFMSLKKTAQQNEKLLIKYQQQILESGLNNFLETVTEDTNGNIPTKSSQDSDMDNESELGLDEEFELEKLVKSEICVYKEENFDENVDDIKPKLIDIDKKELKKRVDPSLEGVKQEINIEYETCNICGRTCRTKKILRSHMLVHTSEMVKCPICIPDKLLKENGLKKHLKNCHKEADVPCDFPGCEKKFKLREIMQRHIKSVHMLERTLCSRCGAAVINLSYHQETCNKDNQKNITCKICDKLFASKMSLSQHEKSIHEPGAPEVCSVCGKAVKDMKSHMRVNHSTKNQRTIPCEVEGCDGMFRTKQEVRNHNNRVHLDLKTQCPICLQWLKNLPEHISQVHEQDRKHVCSQCGKQFFKSSDLKVHIERVHQGRRYVCPECGMTVSKIRDHMKAVHGISDIDMSNISIVKAIDV